MTGQQLTHSQAIALIRSLNQLRSSAHYNAVMAILDQTKPSQPTDKETTNEQN